MSASNVLVSVIKPVCRGFGFLSINDGGPEIFVTQAMLNAAGFANINTKVDDKLVIDYVTLENGKRRVSKIHSLNGQSVTTTEPSKSAPAKLTNALPKNTNRLIVRTVDRNGDLELQKISDAYRPHVPASYRVMKDGKLIKALGIVSLKEARLAIGKVVAPPAADGHGKKTNDPTVSQSMRRPSSGGKKRVA
ncbi:MAG: hypothetical protein AAB388_04380 [Patescibacteria group bacterium]